MFICIELTINHKLIHNSVAPKLLLIKPFSAPAWHGERFFPSRSEAEETPCVNEVPGLVATGQAICERLIIREFIIYTALLLPGAEMTRS